MNSTPLIAFDQHAATTVAAEHRTVRRRGALLRYHGGWTLLHVFTILFGVALMDDDGRNHIGSRKETLSILP